MIRMCGSKCWDVKSRYLGHILRYGLVVRIAGSHPAGPGSIPGNGKFYLFFVDEIVAFQLSKERKNVPTPGVEPGPPG